MQASLATPDAPPPAPAAAEMFSVYQVPTGCINLMWPAVEPLLARAVARERGRFTTNDLYVWCARGEQQLWVITSRGRVWAACLIRIHRHPTGKRSAILHLLAGRAPRAWAKEAWASWRQACRLQGITEMQIVGRKGWARIVRDFGFKPEAVVLTHEEI